MIPENIVAKLAALEAMASHPGSNANEAYLVFVEARP